MSLDLDAVRARLATLRGRAYWQGLEALAELPEFAALVAREFPRHAGAVLDPLDRRQFLKVMGASLALAGLGACTSQPVETIVPYVKAPEQLVPGKPLFFATALTLDGFARGVLVESHMGRPTKIEGNPEHAASLGASDVFTQAAILGLYDPDRSQTITFAGKRDIRTWGDFLTAARTALEAVRSRQGDGLRILSETVTSPTLAAQLGQLLKDLPKARWHQYEPTGRHMARAGALLAFGEDVETRVRLFGADVIVSLDADFLGCGPASLRHVREFTARRRGGSMMNRLYVVESTPSTTGAMADHRRPLRASAIEGFARSLARSLMVPGTYPESATGDGRFAAAVASDLDRHQGRSVVIAGDQQPPAVHAIAHALNHALGNVGKTVTYTAPVEAAPVDQLASLAELAADMQAGRVETLLVLGGNPVLTAPADLRFGETLARVALRIHLGLYDDETAALCHWHIPEAHPLESWSDVRAQDGTVTVVQPLIAPLYGGKSAHEVLAAFSATPERSGYELVRAYWQGRLGAGNFERSWERVLHDGFISATALPERRVKLRPFPPPSAPPPAGELEVVVRPDPSVHDGRFANNGWLQELPRPLTKLTWDNAALVSPATAARLELSNEDVVELARGGRTVRAPVLIVPGHAEDSVTVHLGYGRTRAGRLGTGVGFDAYPLRTIAEPWIASDLRLRKTGASHQLVVTQGHFSMEGRHLARAVDIADYRAHPHLVHEMGHEPPADMTLYPPYRYDGHAWGMAIDLSACVGCNACVIACQAENNIPVVGKAEVARGREMHWIRVDTYYSGNAANPAIIHQPVPCMHCENAPCEVVCPVAATVHSAEGLNDMVYNRCVGTRYCSNNCPYKVRRFNFFLYADFDTPSLKLGRNPDVTVRSRGVMEKCTYCVQRINSARITAEVEGRPIRDGEIVTACQQACPAEAIVFGDINDPASRVARLKAETRNYGILTDLNTRPRTTYLARLENPHPKLREDEA
jgi:molybdopterin-containing oxidoreductase family iron-sulfur binding subunit